MDERTDRRSYEGRSITVTFEAGRWLAGIAALRAVLAAAPGE
ncbi:Divergent 4Fe-4S mono-cluster domain-containing protein OS=Streptomyces microflavus OX=1919 GN=G3I39_07085 PE=4 SV=1 [Streptomyces microflavus]